MGWNTRFTSKFPCKLPIMAAPMAGVSGGLLAAETCRAGGLGFIGGGHLTNLSVIDEQVKIFKKNSPTNYPLAIGFIGYSSMKDGKWQNLDTVLKKHNPSVVQFSFPSVVKLPSLNMTNVQLAKRHNCLVICQVGSVSEAKEAIDSGADAIIAQGSEAGGHGLQKELGSGTLPLAAHVVSLARKSTHKPVILAAGGIVDGRGLTAALTLGCDGIVLGTRLWASKEALGHKSFKECLADPKNGPDQVTRTTVMDSIANTTSSTPWPEPYNSVGVLRNQTTKTWDGRESQLTKELSDLGNTAIVTEYMSAMESGDASIASVYSGEGVGDITSIDNAYDIIDKINKEAVDIIQNMPKLYT